jgi:hypothetical protein
MPDGRLIVGEADDYFTALLAVRRILEADGVFILCQGARRDVWPSGLAFQMSDGLKAYVLPQGRPATSADVVELFDPADARAVGTIAEQNTYGTEWQERWRSEHRPESARAVRLVAASSGCFWFLLGLALVVLALVAAAVSVGAFLILVPWAAIALTLATRLVLRVPERRVLILRLSSDASRSPSASSSCLGRARTSVRRLSPSSSCQLAP